MRDLTHELAQHWLLFRRSIAITLLDWSMSAMPSMPATHRGMQIIAKGIGQIAADIEEFEING